MPTENSIITVFRREMLCRYTSGDISGFAPVGAVKFGNGGADSSGIAIPPSPTQNDLTAPFLNGTYFISGVSFPLDPAPRTTARYTVVIPAGDLPGETINEAALLDTNGNVLAIKTMANKIKDAGVTFTFSFDDEF